MSDLSRLINALEDPAFPCNPIPFANGLADLVRERGTDSIRSDDARRILWILMAQAYGQMARVDLCEEWSRLTCAARHDAPPAPESAPAGWDVAGG